MTARMAILSSWPAGLQPPEGFSSCRVAGATMVFSDAAPFFDARRCKIVGWAFRRDGFDPCRDLSPSEVDAIIESSGKWALRHLWGNFVLVWGDAGDRIHILRSPITGPAVFHVAAAASRTTSCAFTDLALARSLGFALDRPCASAIDARLRFPYLRGERTEIEDVCELLPGQVMRLGAGPSGLPAWSPWDFTLRPPKRARADELGSLVRSIVAAWSGRFDRVQLELSGGIDSSIVAACLGGEDRQWRAVTIATADPDGDERIYARAVCDRFGAELEEILLPRTSPDPLAPIPNPRVRPGGFGLLDANDVTLLATAREYRAAAIFSGTGGDGSFGYHTSIAPALDALRFAGPRAGVAAARDLAAITGDTIWHALRLLVRGLVANPRQWPVDPSLLSQHFADARPNHPWTGGAREVAAGQRSYAMKLLLIQTFLDGYDRALVIPKIAPLLSQPLVEYGLGIQSWQWGEGGQNRALAREAFRDDLPEIILARRSKGRILSLFLPAFEANRERLRSFLLGGWLADAGIIDNEAIDDLLTGRTKAGAIAMIRILQLTDMERWVRTVTDKGVPDAPGEARPAPG
ncbi:asparagine synthase C-terminal domain-containing protein [Sphingopyxis sp. KK2]|uniref:asparagine synthase-related protein n=1 Tax=Sphingopyxis sp. KK2 TaxID=1855727 RepID=UPI0009F9F52C|nr:asparagine synthase C-terminal domain-containing protein [Sphingopyxis sp. KK2]